MRQLAIAFFVLTTISKSTFGQATSSVFYKGTIIKKDGVSIKGYVESAVIYHSKVAYKLTEGGKEHSVKMKEVSSIQTPSGYMENINFGNKERLMGMVADGKVKLFSNATISTGKTNQGQGDIDGLNRFQTTIYVLKKEGMYFEINKKQFKSSLLILLNEQPLLVERINSDAFKFEDIEKIVNEYNNHRRQITTKVIDSETKKPIKDARVAIPGTSTESITNFLGFAQIIIGIGDTLIIFHPEYEISQIKVPAVDNFQISLTRIPIKRKGTK